VSVLLAQPESIPCKESFFLLEFGVTNEKPMARGIFADQKRADSVDDNRLRSASRGPGAGTGYVSGSYRPK
jgi:hypothetical protein